MKTPKKTEPTTPRRRYQIKMLAMAAGLIVPTASTWAQTLWQAGTGDFNVPASWNGTYIDGANNSSPNPNCSNDNGSNNIVLIQPGDPAWYHGDTLAGNANNTTGAYIQTGSTNNTGYPSNGNWLRLGIGTGSAGFYTLSNGTVNVAGQTHLGEHGFGYLEVDGGVYNTGYNGNPGICAGDGDFGVSTGTLVLNGGVITNISNETWFGEGSGCLGTMIMSGGTFNANNWFVFGRNGATGYGTMTGGTLNFHGGGQFLIGGGGVGSLAQSGGTINAFNQYLVPQSSGGGSGRGTNIVSGTAVLNVHDWLAVGRQSGYGELDVSGTAVITRDNNNNGQDSNSHFDVGAGGVGVLNQNGGTINETTSDFWLGESATGTWNLNSGTANLQNLVMSVNTNGVTSTLNLNGGLLQVISLTSPTPSLSISTLNLNGGTIQAAANSPSFINGIVLAFLNGNVTIDSQAFTVTVPQVFQDGGGNLTKIGSGTLLMNGGSSYGGTTTVSAGTLATTTTSGGGGYVVSSGATLNVQVVGNLNGQFNIPSLAVTGPASVGIDLNTFGNPSSAPISAGALSISGTLTINVNDNLPQIGQFPLISYSSKTGSTYVLGSLPVGVVAHLVDNTANNSIDLAITSVNLPRWNGNVNGIWDIATTANWVNIGTGLATTYGQGNAVVFDDNATGTTSISLGVNVTPASFTINNNSLSYSLSGTGSVNGSTGVSLQGIGTFAMNTTNGYTGPTTIANGTLSVNNLANGGLPSAIGASSANPTNLVLASGTLSYSGSPAVINRGYSLQNTNSSIDTESNLTLSGLVTTFPSADFVKTGPGRLTYATVGVNALSGSTSLGYRTIAGSTKFDGSNGGQTNNVLGHFGVGGLNGTNAFVILTNTTLNVMTGGIDLGRSGGAVGTLAVNNGAILNAGSGNFALGDGGGVVSTGVVNQAGGIINVVGPQMFVGQNVAGVGTYNLSGGTLNINNWLAVGRQSGSGVFNLSGTGVLNKTGGGNIDIGTSAGIGGFAGTGVLNQSGGAITNTASQTWLGEGVSGQAAAGTWNMTGGTALLGELHVGMGGTGVNTVNISGPASITCQGFMGLSLNDTNSTGNLNIGNASTPGGTLTVLNDMTVGDQGNATMNFVTGGGGKVTVTGTLYLSRSGPSANGAINLNTGGTLVASYINNGWGFHNNFSSPTNNPNALNFNGGTLKANVGSAFFIQPYVNAVVQSGGAVIDDGGFSVEVLASLVTGGGNGGLTKLGAGTLRLDGTNTYTGTTLVSTGSLAVGPGGIIAGPVSVASGATLLGDAAGIGTPYSINNTLTFASGSTNVMQITPSSNDQIVGLTSVTYGGALVVNNSGGQLTVGHQYSLFNAAQAGTGNFSSVTILPAGAGTFNPTTGVLTITSAGAITINPVGVSNGNLIVTGSGGSAGSTYSLLTATNLLTPLANWTTNTTGVFGTGGTFSNGVPISTTTPKQFFLLKTP